MPPPLTAELLGQLQSIDSCSLSNAIETFDIRLRTEGYGNVRPLLPVRGAVVGYAATCQFRTGGPPPKSHKYFDRTDWWDYLQTIPEPRIVVIQDIDEECGRSALMGEVHVHILRALGVRAVVTNGAVRDLDAIEPLGFPVFAGGTSVSHAYAHLLHFGEPVEVGGLLVAPGDLLHADRHGVLSVPVAIAADLPERVDVMRRHEVGVIDYCRSAQFSLSGLKARVECLG